jgi:formate/nitrite transporter
MADEPTPIRFDAWLPPEMAEKAETIGIKKAGLDGMTMFALSVLAGAFIAMGAIFSTTTVAGMAGEAPYGMIRLAAGLTFTLGLILVVVAGAELFTGNNLIVMAWADGRVNTMALVRNWTIVYIGNFVGSIATAALMFFSRQYEFANTKSGLDFMQALILGIFCNALVCLAVWLCFSARTTTDKILSIIPPIAAFVAAGFEHSVANMYFIPVGLFISSDQAWMASLGERAPNVANLTWYNFFVGNLVPVTIGNIIGGAVMVGLVYWFIYLRPKRMPKVDTKITPIGAGK